MTAPIDEINSLQAGSARQQRVFLQNLRFLSNTLQIGMICVGTPDSHQALPSDPQLQSRFLDAVLPTWTPDAEFQTFLNRYVQTLPLREPSPIESSAFRRLIIEHCGGITKYALAALRRAAKAAIHSGHERIDFETMQSPEIWLGIPRRPPPVLLTRNRR